MSFSCPGSNVNPVAIRRLRVVKGFDPNPTPIIYNLSTYSSQVGKFTQVFITGENFFPFGITTATFGPIQNIKLNYASSMNVSFFLPISNGIALPVGRYDLYLVTINNRTPIFPTSLVSNKVKYTLKRN